MYQKEAYLEKLAKLAKEYEQKVTPAEFVQSRLCWEDWGSLHGRGSEAGKAEG